MIRLLLTFTSLLALCLLTPAHATRILSLDALGNPVAFGAEIQGISGNGRYVVLLAGSPLLPEDTTGQQIYVYDLETDDLELISVQPDGSVSGTATVAYNSPHSRIISTDGRYVLFRTRAADIVPSIDTGGHDQVYRRDRQTQTTILVSVAGDRATAANADIDEYTMDCTGHQILLRTSATTLDDLGQGGTFLHLTEAPPNSGIVTRRACRDVLGDPIQCWNFSLGNGLIAFLSSDPNVAPDDPPGLDAFVGNVIDGNNVLLTKDVGTVATSRSHSAPAAFCDGHRVALRTNINLQFNPDDTLVPDLWTINSQSGQLLRIRDSMGNPLVDNSSNGVVSISDNGLLIGFQTTTSLDPRDTNGVRDGYIASVNGDMSAFEFHYVAHWDDTPSNNGTKLPRLSRNGMAAFESSATNSPWPITQGWDHVFVNQPPDGFSVIFQGGFQVP